MAKQEQHGGDGRPPGRRSPVDTDVAVRVQASALESLSPQQRLTTTLYLDPYYVDAETVLGPSFENVRVRRPSILVFADDVPAANFAHPCRYFLYDESGKPQQRLLARFPPYPARGLHSLRAFHHAVIPAKPPMQMRMREAARSSSEGEGESPSGCGSPPPVATGRRFAILFGGNMEVQHLNNLELTYRTLVDDFGFADANIFRLIHDGTRGAHGVGPYIDFDTGSIRTWPGSTPASTFRITPTGQGTKQAFQDTLKQLDQMHHVTSNDLLFIHTECHGAREILQGDDRVYLCAFPSLGGAGSDQYHAYELGEDLSPLQCGQLLVLMNQCYGGGFQLPVVNATKAATYIACAADASSLAWATLPDLEWNEFSMHWLEAQRRKTLGGAAVNVDGDGDGKIEASEAFSHAKDTDEYGDDTPNKGSKSSAGTDGERIVLSV
jgi:hypothetical protein